MLRYFKLTVAYDGTPYAGWQIQVGRPTVQGMLERAMARLVKVRVPITGSGRTDSGVHAYGQVASLSTDAWSAPADRLAPALNTKLPADIRVLASEEMPGDFHAIRDATGKRYRYQMQIGGIPDPFEYRYRWHLPGPLDIAAMRQAANLLCGTHDFAGFQASGSVRKTTTRTVRELAVVEEQGRGEEQRLAVEIEADGFLYNMVRNIVGSLVVIGHGKEAPEWIQRVLHSGDRRQAGPTAPPQGLFLMYVNYESPLGS